MSGPEFVIMFIVEISYKKTFQPTALVGTFMVQMFIVEEFMDEKFMVEKSVVEMSCNPFQVLPKQPVIMLWKLIVRLLT